MKMETFIAKTKSRTDHIISWSNLGRDFDFVWSEKKRIIRLRRLRRCLNEWMDFVNLSRNPSKL